LDYGYDLEIEFPIKHGNVNFKAKIFGHNIIKINQDNTISQYIETHYWKYWKGYDSPFFLFVIDVLNEKIYWVNIKTLKPYKTMKKGVILRIPIENIISNDQQIQKIINLKKIINLILKELKIEKNEILNNLNLDMSQNILIDYLKENDIKERGAFEDLINSFNLQLKDFLTNEEGSIIRLNLSDKKLKSIPHQLSNFTNLEILNLSQNKIKKIENLNIFSKLEELDISYNDIKKIEGLIELKNLKWLNLNNNQIKRIEGIKNLKKLEELDLSNNQINKIESLSECKKLKFLDLSSNHIERIENIEELNQLQVLTLSNNNINKIEGLETLTQLDTLLLNGNPIIDLKKIPQLKQLSIDVENLKTIMGIEFKVRNLEKLEDYNEILDLYNFISNLIKDKRNYNEYLNQSKNKQALDILRQIKVKLNKFSWVELYYPFLNDLEFNVDELEWILNHRISILKYNKYNFRRFNIFIGKNNSGKTYALRNLRLWLGSDKNMDNTKTDVKLDRDSEIQAIKRIEQYYISNLRILDKPIGTLEREEIKAMLNFFTTINNFQRRDIVNSNEPWKINNFIAIVEILTYEFIDKQEIIENNANLKKLLFLFRRIYGNWIKKINEFFPDIIIKEIKRPTRGGDIKFVYRDNYINKDIIIENWNVFGSGLQQLLGLIFMVEYLKVAPNIRYYEWFDNLPEKLEDLNFQDWIKFIPPNRILYLDEPEVSLHPSLQRAFFQYLKDASKRIQIFIATHSPFIPKIDNLTMIYLFYKHEDGTYDFEEITNENEIKVTDEIFDLDPYETAFKLSRNNYSLFLKEKIDFLNLKMINDLKKYFISIELNLKNDIYQKILRLGTTYEYPDIRQIQNVNFLSSDTQMVSLVDTKKIWSKLKRIIIIQLNKNIDEISDKEERFWTVCKENWDGNIAEEYKVLVYPIEKAEKKLNRIKEEFENLKERKIVNPQSQNENLIIFPENTLPYCSLHYLIKFAQKNKVVIVGGMEHQKFRDIEQINNDLIQKYKDNYKMENYKMIFKNINNFNHDSYLNQAIIINSNGKFTFQIKNLPFYKFDRKNSIDLVEGIPSILTPHIKKIETIFGNMAVLICKDFLVNYEAIPIWMDKNQITIIAIPSFTSLVNPFRNKLGEIINKKENEYKIFIFASLAEYGGSGVYFFGNRYDYEPGGSGSFEERKVGSKIFLINE